MKLKKSVLLMISILILSGCWSLNEAERMLYVHGIGVDYKEGKYEIYTQIINFSKIAKSEEPKSEPEQSEVGFASGKTLDEALFNLYKSADERIYWGHLTYVIFSENALKEGKMEDVIDSFIRYFETRYQVLVYSTTDDVKDVLLTVPIINTAISLSKLANPMNSYEQESYIEPVDMRNLIIGLDEPGHEMTIPYITVVQNWESTTGKTLISNVSGVGVVTPNHFKGFITGDKANGLQWMNDNTKRGEVSFFLEENNEDSVASVVLYDVRVKKKPIIKKDNLQFEIDVSVEAIVSAIPYKVEPKVIKDKTKSVIKQEIMTTYQEALAQGVDIYRLSEQVYRKENTFWKKHEKEGKVELTDESIQLNIEIRKLKSGRKSLTKLFE